jgi:hypothetical protein
VVQSARGAPVVGVAVPVEPDPDVDGGADAPSSLAEQPARAITPATIAAADLDAG